MKKKSNESRNTNTTNNPETSAATPARPAAKFEALKELGIEYQKEIKGKPVFEIQSNSVINMDSHFGVKKLCDGLTFTTGHACVFRCQFCYVETLLRRNKKVLTILKGTGLGFEDIIIEIADAATVARKFLTTKSGPKFNDPNDQRVIYSSPLVDCAATMAHVERTVEVCLVILELTHWQIRLLSKSSLLAEVAKRIPEEYKQRMIYGFSTGTLDDAVARIFEIGTALPSKRIDSLHRLQDEGYRTFGMPCPTLPQRDYDQFAKEMAETIRVDQCEHVWVEVLNPRGNSLPATATALRNAGLHWEADQLELVAHEKLAREDYARKTFEAFTKVIPAEKLRFMQYQSADSFQWWKERESQGAVLIGRHATPSVNGKTNRGNAAPVKRQLTEEPLSAEEKKLWAEYQKVVRRNFKTCLTAYVQLGEFLAKIRDQRLYREDFKSFEVYCRKELEIARSTAYGYISDFEVSTQLSEISDISKLTKEIHLRPVTSLQAAERQKAIEMLKSRVGAEPLTPEMLKDVASEIIAMRVSSPPPGGLEEAPVLEVGDNSATQTSAPATASSPPEVVVSNKDNAETIEAEVISEDTQVAPQSGPEATAVPVTVYIDSMRRIVRSAAETSPSYNVLLAKELRDLASTLESSAAAPGQSNGAAQ